MALQDCHLDGNYFIGAALLGALLLSKGLARALLIGLLSGYIVFGLVFTYHIQTHSYYSLQLVPIVALAIGFIVELVGAHVSQVATQWYERVAIFGVLLVKVL